MAVVAATTCLSTRSERPPGRRVRGAGTSSSASFATGPSVAPGSIGCAGAGDDDEEQQRAPGRRCGRPIRAGATCSSTRPWRWSSVCGTPSRRTVHRSRNSRSGRSTTIAERTGSTSHCAPPLARTVRARRRSRPRSVCQNPRRAGCCCGCFVALGALTFDGAATFEPRSRRAHARLRGRSTRGPRVCRTPRAAPVDGQLTDEFVWPRSSGRHLATRSASAVVEEAEGAAIGGVVAVHRPAGHGNW